MSSVTQESAVNVVYREETLPLNFYPKLMCYIQSDSTSTLLGIFEPASVMTQQPCQLWPSTSVCLCPPSPPPHSPPPPPPLPGPLWLLWAQAFVGVWPLRLEKKEEGIMEGEHRLGRRACMCVRWECWLASADATQASAVSSHQLIPLPRSPCDPEVLGSLLWPGTFSMDGEGWTEAPRTPACQCHIITVT